MRTTIDLPDDLFREAKTRAVQQGTSLKNLVTQLIRAGLRAQSTGETRLTSSHRNPPPVAIRRTSGNFPLPAMTNRQLHAMLEEEEIRTSHRVGNSDQESP